jgi:hypothetical protein
MTLATDQRAGRARRIVAKATRLAPQQGMPEAVPRWLLREQPIKRFQIDQHLRQCEADQAEMASANGLEGQGRGRDGKAGRGHDSGLGRSDGRHAASSTGCTGLMPASSRIERN